MDETGHRELLMTAHWSNASKPIDHSDNSNEPLQLTKTPGSRLPQGCNGVVEAYQRRAASPTTTSEMAASLTTTPTVAASTALPVRFVVEFVDLPPDVRSSGRRRIEDYAIIPSPTKFSDLTAKVLQKCGLEHVALSESTAYLSLRNWKPLTLDQVCAADSQTVAEILGDVINTATLRIFCRVTAAMRQAAELKDRLLRLLVSHGSGILTASGCPLDEDTLMHLTSEALPSLSAETVKSFNQWYDAQKLGRTQAEPQKQEVNSQCQSAHDHFHQCSKPRVRTSFDIEYEIPKLQKWYSINPHPNKMQMQYFMEEMNVYRAGRNRKPLEINNIIYWFKNSRAAQKKYEQRAQSDLVSPAPPASDDDDDCSLSASEEPDGDDVHMAPSGPPGPPVEPVKQEDGSDADERHDSAVSCSPQEGHGYRLPLAAPYMNHMTSAHFERIGYGVDPSVFRQSMSMYMSGCLPGLQGVGYPSVPLTADHQRKRNRTFIDPISEVPLLEKWFSINTHPCHTTILQYTDELNRQPYRHKFPKLEPKNVQFWFKNRRAKNKRLRSAM